MYSPPKEEKPFVFPKYFKIIILVLSGLIILVYLFLFSPLFKIKGVEIIGNPSQEVRDYLNQYIGRNLFLVDSKEIKTQVESYSPELYSVKVLRGIPSTLRVDFDERSPKLIWQTNNKYYYIDENGQLYKEAPALNTDIPLVIDTKNIVVTVPSQIAGSSFVEFIKNAKSNIKSSGIEITQFDISETIFQVEAVTNASIKLKFDTTRNLTDQIDAFTKVFSEHKADIKEYMDLRVEGKVYYK